MKAPLFTLAATTMLALAACGGNKPPAIAEVAKNNEVEVTTPRMELTALAQSEYKDHFWGVGDAVSTKEQMAASQASLNARAAMVEFMQTQITVDSKQSSMNTMEDQAVEGFVERIKQHASEMVANSQIRKERTMYNKEDGQYHVYVLISVPRKDAYGSLKNKLSTEQTVADVIVTKAVMDFIDAELGK